MNRKKAGEPVDRNKETAFVENRLTIVIIGRISTFVQKRN